MTLIMNDVIEYCRNILVTSKVNKLPFHNLTHTQEVVTGVNIITEKEGITGNDCEIILIAAWFHDTGFTLKYHDHEEASISFAKEFLQIKGYPIVSIKQVIECIKATKMPQHPTTPLAEVLCDADLFHASTPNFFYRNLLLRKEWEIENGCIYSDIEWHKLNFEFLQNHQYFTKYGRDVLVTGQSSNIHKMQNLINIYNSIT